MPAFYLSAGRRRRIGQVERAKARPRGCLSVALGNALNLVLLLDGIAVRGALRRASGRGRSASGLAPGGPGEERSPPGCRPGPPTPQHRAPAHGPPPPPLRAAPLLPVPGSALPTCAVRRAPHALPPLQPPPSARGLRRARAPWRRARAPWRRSSPNPSP